MKNPDQCLQFSNAGKWREQISLQGRRLSRTFSTRGEAQQWIRQTLDQIDDGLTYLGTKLTLAEYLEDWLTIKKATRRYAT